MQLGEVTELLGIVEQGPAQVDGRDRAADEGEWPNQRVGWRSERIARTSTASVSHTTPLAEQEHGRLRIKSVALL